MQMVGRNASTGDYRYGFNGMEKDDELKGSGNSVDFGARMYDSRLGRWLSLDPMQAKYPELSPYTGIGNNPIIYIDPDGRDIVYFDKEGTETSRVVNPDVHETYVKTTVTIFGYVLGDFDIKAPMPNRINKAKAGDSHDYNQYDHLIAAETYLFNRWKGTGTLKPKTNLASDPADEEITDLDPNTVKLVMLKETRYGKLSGGFRKGKVDVMQANVTGDWSWKKSKVGFTKGGSAGSVQQGVAGEIMLLYWKGLSVSKVKDEDGKTTGYETKWVGGPDWWSAIIKYNGGGDPNYEKKLNAHKGGLDNNMSDGAYEESQAAEQSTGSGSSTPDPVNDDN